MCSLGGACCDAEGSASGTDGLSSLSSQFLMQYHQHQTQRWLTVPPPDSQVTALRSGEPHPAPWDPHTHSCQLRFTWITAVSCKHDVDAHLQLLPAPVIDQLSISYEVIIRATGASLQVIVRRRWRHSCLQRLTSRPEEHLSTLAPLPVTTKTKPPNSFHKDVMLVILEVVLVFLRDPGRSLLDSFLPH